MTLLRTAYWQKPLLCLIPGLRNCCFHQSLSHRRNRRSLQSLNHRWSRRSDPC